MRKLGICFFCGFQHSIFHDLRSYGPFRCHFPHLPRCNAHILCNGLRNHRRIFENGVQLLTPQNAGGKSLGELQHGGLSGCRSGSGQSHLFVELLRKVDDLPGVLKGSAGQRAQLRHRVRHVGIYSTGPHSRRVNLILCGGCRFCAACHKLEAGGGLCDFIRHRKQLEYALKANIGSYKAIDFAGKSVGSNRSYFLLLCLQSQRRRLSPCRCGRLIECSRLNSGRGRRSLRRIFQLLC